MSLENNEDIVILVSPLLIEGIADAFRRQIKDGLPVTLIWSGKTARYGQGVIVLEWDGKVPESFLDQLAQDADCIDYMVYAVPTVEGDFISASSIFASPITERSATETGQGLE